MCGLWLFLVHMLLVLYLLEGFEWSSSVSQECIIDEDCEKGSYCLYETQSSKCLPCKHTDAVSGFKFHRPGTFEVHLTSAVIH